MPMVKAQIGRIKEAVYRVLSDALEGLEWTDSFEPIPEPDTDRAISTNQIWEQIRVQIFERYGDLEEELQYRIWLHDIIVDDGNLYAVFSDTGRLYRAAIDLIGTTAYLGAIQEVEANYSPAVRERTFLTDDPETGRVRYTRYISNAFLLRGTRPEIDSTELYDSFIRRVQETGQYARASLLHKGAALRVGQGDILIRDGVCLIESGLFDDTPLARAFIEELRANPDYWGTSIEYEPQADARIERIGDIDVEVWTEGLHLSSDWLPETQAAAWFTGTIHSKGSIMTSEEQRRLRAGGVSQKLIDEIESRSREINDYAKQKGVISRKNRDVEPEAEPEETTEAEANDKEAEAEGVEEIEIGEDVIEEIATRVVAKAITPLLEKLERATTELREDVDALLEDDQSRARRYREMAPPRGQARLTLGKSVKRAADVDDDDDDDDDDNDFDTYNRRESTPSRRYERSSLAASVRARGNTRGKRGG